MKIVFPCSWYYAIGSTLGLPGFKCKCLKNKSYYSDKSCFYSVHYYTVGDYYNSSWVRLSTVLDSCMIVSLYLFFHVNFYMDFLFLFCGGGGVGWSRTVTECHCVTSCSWDCPWTFHPTVDITGVATNWHQVEFYIGNVSFFQNTKLLGCMC